MSGYISDPGLRKVRRLNFYDNVEYGMNNLEALAKYYRMIERTSFNTTERIKHSIIDKLEDMQPDMVGIILEKIFEVTPELDADDKEGLRKYFERRMYDRSIDSKIDKVINSSLRDICKKA